MQDTNIKGSGNSRMLASVPDFLTLYPTYEDFARALINRELPIDLGPLNESGLNVRGTDLNKETLLKDTTAALYGLGTDATPDDILVMVNSQLNTALGRTKLQKVTYSGTGTYGKSNPTRILFKFPLVCVFIGTKSRGNLEMGIFVSPLIVGACFTQGGNWPVASTWSGNQVSIYSEDSTGMAGVYQFNLSKVEYTAIAFG